MTTGHNNPPSTVEFAVETAKAVNDWLMAHPVIQTEDESREAKLHADRARDALKEMEIERKAKIAPLNVQISEIRESYRPADGALFNIIQELGSRLTAFIRAEEARRQHEAELKRQALVEAERIAREAERLEQEALENAKAGEVVDVAKVKGEADQRFAEFQKLERETARAEKATHVKIGGGFRRALSLRQKETLVLEDYKKALAAIGVTDKIQEAILSEARAYRTEYGELPPGVTSKKEQAI